MFCEFPLQPVYRMGHIQAAGLIRVSLVTYSFQYVISDILDETTPTAAERGMNGTASGMSKHDDLMTVQMCRGVFYAAKLVPVKNISRNTDHKQFPDVNGKDMFRNHASI